MPRIKGAVNLLVRIKLPDQETYYFPRSWWDILGNKVNGNQRDQIAMVWGTAMQSAGYTAERVYSIRENITDFSDSKRCLGIAMDAIVPAIKQQLMAEKNAALSAKGVAPNAAHTTQTTQPGKAVASDVAEPSDEQPDQGQTWDTMTQVQRKQMVDEAVPPGAKIVKTFDASEQTSPAVIKKALPKFPYNKTTLDSLVQFAAETQSKYDKDPENTRYAVSPRQLLKTLEDIEYNGVPLWQSVQDNMLAVAKMIDEEEYKAVFALAQARFGNADNKVVTEALELLAKGPALPDTLPPGVPERKTPFQTDEHYFYGLVRANPKAEGGAKLKHKYVDGDPNVQRILRRLATGRRPLALVGPSGTGKTELGVYFGNQVGWYTHIQPHTSQTDVHEVVGTTEIVNGNTVFVDGPLTRGFSEGWVYIADEETSPKPGVTMMYQEIKNGGDLVVTTAAGVRVVHRHPHFRYVGTFNPWSTYAGSNELNPAQLERSYVTYYGYPKAAKMTQILTNNFPVFAQA